MEINLLMVIFSSMAGLSYSACPQLPNGHCLPPNGRTCITGVQNGTGMNWFQMQSICGQHSGRLVWLMDPFNVRSLSSADHLLKNYSTVATGLIGSVKTLMWANPNSSVCGSVLTDVCALHLENEFDCSALGCCMSNGKCHYPEHENVTTYNESGPIEGLTTTERKCIGMIKVNNSFTKPNWTACNCSEPIPGHAGFVCEYKCESQWPNMVNEHIVWTTTARPDMVNQYSTSTTTTARPDMVNQYSTSTTTTARPDMVNQYSTSTTTTSRPDMVNKYSTSPTTAIKSPSTNNRGTHLCSKDWAMQAVFSISYLIILYKQIF